MKRVLCLTALCLTVLTLQQEQAPAAKRRQQRSAAVTQKATRQKATTQKPSGIWGTAAWVDRQSPHRWIAINPLGNHVVVVRRASDKRVVRRVVSDYAGLFQITLPPGSYRVELELASDRWRLVTVRRGAYARADITLDQPLDMSPQ